MPGELGRLEQVRAELEKNRATLEELDRQRRVLLDRIQWLEMVLAKDKYTCSCVRLNGALGITTMVEQEAAGRRGLQLGSVAETLSAKKDCPKCKGKGVPARKKTV